MVPQTKNHKIALVLYLAAIVMVSVLVFIYLPLFDQSKINYLSIIGSLASVVGLIMVLFQISRLLKNSELLQATSEDTKRQILFFTTALEILKWVKICQEIQIYYRNKKYEMSILRMQDLREFLFNLDKSKEFDGHLNKDALHALLVSLSLDISSIETELMRKDEKLIPLKLISNMQKMQDFLSQISAQLKNSGGVNGTRN